MNLLLDLHRELIETLVRHDVGFIVIGGYAVIHHGYNRTTGDIDLWLRPDNANKEKLLQALKAFGIDDESLNDVRKLDFTQASFFKIGDEPERIDFLTRINLVNYDDADKEKVVADVDGLKIPFLHFNHLILSKINTDRQQDKADVDMLQRIHKLREE